MRRVGVKFAVGHAGDPENGEPADFGPLHITVIEHLTHGVNPGTPDPETVEISTGTLYAWRAPDDALQRAGEFIDWYTLVAADGPSYTLSVVAAEASLRPSQDAMVTMIESFVPRSEFD
jgi:hypothetical protein